VSDADPAPPPLNYAPDPAPPATGMLAQFLAVTKKRGIAVLIDQAVVSMGNFLTLALLGRHLIAAEFGAYGLIMETLFFLNGVQFALVIYPLTIRGATGDHGTVRQLTLASLLFTVLLVPFTVIVMGKTAIATGVGFAAAAAVLATLLWQVQETLRRALMAELRFSAAVWGDAISYLGQAAIILALVLPSPANVIVLVAGAIGEVGEIIWGRRLAKRWRPKTGPEAMIGKPAQVVEPCHPNGEVRVHGELWAARCDAGADVGDTVTILALDGLTLVVAPGRVAAAPEAGPSDG
jgi:membrane protein implicated in regulation of membrane protease activity